MINANEKRLKALQKELAKEYSKSEKEIQRIMAKYLKAFQEADAIEISRLQRGEITFAQYQKWRREKLQTSEWSRALLGTTPSAPPRTHCLPIPLLQGFPRSSPAASPLLLSLPPE